MKKVLIAALLLLSLAACTDLAGEVEIVATDQPTQQIVPNLANGAQIYAQNCTSCHGANGAGNGELVESGEVPRMPSFLEAQHMRQQSLAFYLDIITNGNLVNLMPPWGEALTEQEIYDVAMYVHTLHYTSEQLARGAELVTDTPALFMGSDNELAGDLAEQYQITDEEASFDAAAYARVANAIGFEESREEIIPEPRFETIDIFGTVTNGSQGGSVPAGLVVTLGYGNQEIGVQTIEQNIGADNTFRFEDVPYDPAASYLVVTQYENIDFPSPFRPATTLDAENEMNITLYERIGDPNIITLSDINLTIDRINVPSMGTGLVFTQVNTYTNDSDRIYLAEPEDSFPFSVVVDLPPGSRILNDPNSQRYRFTEEGTTIVDTDPMPPGEKSNQIVYFVPYTDGAVIDFPVYTRMIGSMQVNILPETIGLQGEAFTIAEEPVASAIMSAEEISRQFNADYRLSFGDRIVFNLDGNLFERVASENATVVSSDQLVPILGIFGVIAIIVIGGVVVFLRSRNTAPANQALIDDLLNRIADLEAQHDAGHINHDVFQRERTKLREQLRVLMRNEQPE